MTQPTQTFDGSNGPFLLDACVRLNETDCTGMVHHSQYLIYCELARVELLQRLGIDYRQLLDQGLIAVLVEAFVRYRVPLRYGDTFRIETHVVEVSRVTIRFRHTLRRNDTTFAEVETRLACLSHASGQPERIPEQLASILAKAVVK